MSTRLTLCVLALGLCGWPTMTVSAAQQAATGATLAGTVVDPSGAWVAGASVTVRGSDGASRATQSNHTGRFIVVDLPPGEYTVDVKAPGLGATKALSIREGSRAQLAMTLEVEGVHQELVVAAQRLGGHSPLEHRLPGSYDTIDRTTLDRTHPHDVNEALRKVSGLTVRDEEGLGLRPNIGIRGLNPTRSSKTLLLEDGVPLTFAPYGDNASYYHPPIERFDVIEVLKGSGQIAYGPSTIGGVVNYITPVPPARPAGTVSVTTGNRSFVDANGTVGTTRGRVGFLFDVLRKASDGARANTHSDLTDLTAKFVATVRGSQIFTLKTNYYGESSQITYSGLREDEFRSDPRQNPFVNDAFEGDRAGASLAHSVALTDRMLLTTTSYASRFARDWWRQSSNSGQRPNDSADLACGGMANLLTTCGNEGRLRRYLTFGVEARLHFQASAAGAFDAGVRVHGERQERRQENGPMPTSRSGVLVEDNARDANAMSGFVQHRFVAGRLAVTPGVRVEHVQFSRLNRLANGGGGAAGASSLTQLVPGVGASFAATDRAVLFAGIHRGFAPPRVEDVIGNSGGLVDLDAELSWNAELGIRSEPWRGVRFDATWFRMDYSNQIVPATLAGGVGAALTNAGQTLHQGIEVSTRVDSARWQLTPHNFYLRTAYTFVPTARFLGRRTSNIRGFEQVSVAGNRLPYAPRHLLNAGVGFAHERWFDVSIEASSIGAQFGDDLNTVEPSADGQRGTIPASVVWNGALNWFVRPSRLTAYLAVKNLFDRLYVVDRSRGILPGSPRLVHAGVRVSF